MSSFHFQTAQPIESIETGPAEAPFNLQRTNHDSSNVSASFSGTSDGFDRSSSLFDDDSFSSRESSPAFDIVYNPDLSYRREAAARAQASTAASSADIAHNDNTEIISPDDIETDDELWDELMGMSTIEPTEPQQEKAAPALDLASPGPNDEEDGDEDEMIAMMTASLETELAETQQEEQLAAEKQAAEAELQKKALLEEQLRVAAEKAALDTQFDHLLSPAKKKSKSASIRRHVGRAGLADRLERVDFGMNFKKSANTAARNARKKAMRKLQNPDCAPVAFTVPPMPSSSERTPSNASSSKKSTHKLSRVYHRTDKINWGPLLERMHLTTNLDLKACYQTLGLDPVRGQEISSKLREYLRTPGNSVNVSREIGIHRTKQITAEVAHKLLYDQLWGETYFNRPHVGCGYTNVKFETDSTWIFNEFSKLLYKIIKAEERRKKAHLRSQQKRDAINAAQHPVVSELPPAVASYAPHSSSNLLQAVVPQLVPAQPALAQPAPAQSLSMQPVPIPARKPVMDYTMFMRIYGGRR